MPESRSKTLKSGLPSAGEWGTFAVICLAQVVASLVAFGLLILTDFAYDACGTSPGDRICSREQSASAHDLLVLGIVIFALIVAGAAIFGGRRSSHVWWVPALGVAGVLVVGVIAVSMNLAGADALN